MPLDPQVAALLAQMQEAGAKPFEELSVPEARVAARSFADLQGEPEPVARIDHMLHPRTHGRPPGPDLHAGGRGPAPGPRLLPRLGLGRAQHRGVRHHDARARQLHRLRGRRRQLPEGARAPVPGPVRGLLGHDAVDVRERGSARHRPRADRRDRRQRGRQPRRRRRPCAPATRARREIAFQALIYPAVEHNWDTGSAHENAEGYLLQRESMHWFWDHYVPDKSLVDDWRVSPLKAERPLRPAARVHRHGRVRPAPRRRPRLPCRPARRGRARDLRRVRRDDPRLLLDAGRRRRHQAPPRGPRGSDPRGPRAGEGGRLVQQQRKAAFQRGRHGLADRRLPRSAR